MPVSVGSLVLSHCALVLTQPWVGGTGGRLGTPC